MIKNASNVFVGSISTVSANIISWKYIIEYDFEVTLCTNCAR